MNRIENPDLRPDSLRPSILESASDRDKRKFWEGLTVGVCGIFSLIIIGVAFWAIVYDIAKSACGK